jgi:hypothetical protein
MKLPLAASLLFALAAVIWMPARALAAPAAPTTVWSPDTKTLKELQPNTIFQQYDIRLPHGFTQLSNDEYDAGTRTQWAADARNDGTRPIITVWVVQLTRDQVAADPIAYGVKLLQDTATSVSTGYIPTKLETGMVGPAWATRFGDTCTLHVQKLSIPIQAANYIWQDGSKLVLATAFDAQPYVKDTLPTMEASIQTIYGDPILDAAPPQNVITLPQPQALQVPSQVPATSQ